jgi:hypothetical protein
LNSKFFVSQHLLFVNLTIKKNMIKLSYISVFGLKEKNKEHKKIWNYGLMNIYRLKLIMILWRLLKLLLV